MNKDAFYFPHFSNARTDRKLLRVRKELGIEGYGIYFMILEVLRDTPEYKYPLEDIDLLASEFVTSEQKVRTVICNYKLFEVDENQCFFSTRFNEYLQPYLRMKQQRIDAGKASAAKRLLNDRSTTVQQSKVKESKVKESKVNKVKESKEDKDNTPALEEFLSYCKELLQSRFSDFQFTLTAKYTSWVESGWKDGNGSKIKNWKTKIQNTLPYLKPMKSQSTEKIVTLTELMKNYESDK